MDENEIYEKIREILICAKKYFEKESKSTIEAWLIARDLSMDETAAAVLLTRMREKGLVDNPYSERDMYRITDYGIRELDTMYNPEYQKKVELQRQEERSAAESEKKRQEEREDKKHRDTLRWNKLTRRFLDIA